MVNYSRLNQIVFLLWDNEESFNDEDTQIRIGNAFLSKERVYNQDGYSLDEVLQKYESNPNQEFIFFIHLDHYNNMKGFHTFQKGSDTLSKFPNLKYYIVSRVPKKEIFEKGTNLTIFDWDLLYSDEGVDRLFIPQTVGQMKFLEDATSNEISKIPKFKYAIFTALFEEFKAIEDLIEWDHEKGGLIETDTIEYKVGLLKGTDKQVVACFAGKTGMTEAAVICTEMINRFHPEYILMPGVCGGSDKTEFGDVIVANKVFLLGKGKLKDVQESINGKMGKANLYYKGHPLKIDEIQDSNGNPVRVIAERFEDEIEVVNMDEKLLQKIEQKLEDIQSKINKPYLVDTEKIKVRLDPMACSLSVIDKEDYFEINIKNKDRKTKAVEMESYGVARAASKSNGGNTKFLIFKSVMDKTSFKTDKYKGKAAYTSAQFLKYLIQDDII